VLVLATRLEHGDHHEIGVGVAPPPGLDSGGLCRIGCPPQKPEIAESRCASQVLQADAGDRRRQDIEILGRRVDEEQ
jgi:hypothetical protein